MEELDLLILKFWAGQTTESENIRLNELLNKDSDDILLGLESSGLSNTETLGEPRSTELLEALHGRLSSGPDNDKVTERLIDGRRNRHYWIAAASVLLILTSMFSVFRFVKKSGRQIAETEISVQPDLVNVVNSSDSVMVLTLSDSSVIRLSPRSAITYYKPFLPGKRDISLVGIAAFDVAKDAQQPFSVYTGRLSTTALGTRFVVDATSQNKFVKVRLMEGKVVLRSAEMKDVYLIPGQQCKFEVETGVAKVGLFNNADQKYEAKKSVETSLQYSSKGLLTYVQKPLSFVFQQIGKQYDVEIESPDADINAISFTGTFFPSDSLESILAIICASNDLSFEKRQNIITIKKAD